MFQTNTARREKCLLIILICTSEGYWHLSMSRFEGVFPATGLGRGDLWPALSGLSSGGIGWGDNAGPLRPTSCFSVLCQGDNTLSSKTCRLDPYLSWWVFCFLLLFMEVLVFGLLACINFKKYKRYHFIVFA